MQSVKQLRIMGYIQSGAVIQAGETFSIRGHAGSHSIIKYALINGEKVFENFSESGINGRFVMKLPPVRASFDEYTLVITDGNETLRFTEILFGEVFHISGQSNMELAVRRTYHPFKPFEHRESSTIREFKVPVKCRFSDDEQEDFSDGKWLRAVGDELLEMSAAGYYFALELQEKLGCPVGLLNTSAGGSSIESRMSRDMLESFGWYENYLEKYKDPDYMQKQAAADSQNLQEWYKELDRLDTVSENVFSESFVADGLCVLPEYLRNINGLERFSGRIWFRKRFSIPENTPLENVELVLGCLIDSDRAYINGEKVGETGYMYPPRYYRFDGSLLHHGENTLAVCLDVMCENGGFVTEKDYCLKVGGTVIDLSGEWEYAAICTKTLNSAVFFPELPMSLYSAMTAPAFGINVKGLLWYQGETNAWHPERYFDLFSEFAKMFRKRCRKDLPIIIAQLPNYAGHGREVGTSWAKLRLEQERCTSVGNCALAVMIGCGESNDLHPIDKKTVGQRLAWSALELIYGITLKRQSKCVSAEYSDGTVKLNFDGAEVHLANSPTKYFEAVINGRKVPVYARITDSHTLVFDCPGRPELVRYAYTDDPGEPDIFSVDGLPAAPFELHIS